MERARSKGIDATIIDPMAIKAATPQQPAKHDGEPCLVASIGDIKIGRRLGYGPFAFLEHGAGQSYGNTSSGAAASYAGGPDRADNELFLCPNEYSANLWRTAYPQARVEIVGCPKLDTLPLREPHDPNGSPVICTSFHWPAPVSVSGYAGTAVGEYLPAVGELAKSYTVIGHSHPKGDWPKRMERLYARQGIPFVGDFEDVCRRADVYVCDNSSTLFEFAATGRPVVVLNSKQWSRKFSVGLRFWDAAEVGVNVNRPEDLAAAVELALADPPERQVAREAALQIVYGLRTNGATAAATAILDWLATKLVTA